MAKESQAPPFQRGTRKLILFHVKYSANNSREKKNTVGIKRGVNCLKKINLGNHSVNNV